MLAAVCKETFISLARYTPLPLRTHAAFPPYPPGATPPLKPSQRSLRRTIHSTAATIGDNSSTVTNIVITLSIVILNPSVAYQLRHPHAAYPCGQHL